MLAGTATTRRVRRLWARPNFDGRPPCSCRAPTSRCLDSREGRMRLQASLISILAMTAAGAFLLAGWDGAAAPNTTRNLAQRGGGVAVDTELVIAVDVS